MSVFRIWGLFERGFISCSLIEVNVLEQVDVVVTVVLLLEQGHRLITRVRGCWHCATRIVHYVYIESVGIVCFERRHQAGWVVLLRSMSWGSLHCVAFSHLGKQNSLIWMRMLHKVLLHGTLSGDQALVGELWGVRVLTLPVIHVVYCIKSLVQVSIKSVELLSCVIDLILHSVIR